MLYLTDLPVTRIGPSDLRPLLYERVTYCNLLCSSYVCRLMIGGFFTTSRRVPNMCINAAINSVVVVVVVLVLIVVVVRISRGDNSNTCIRFCFQVLSPAVGYYQRQSIDIHLPSLVLRTQELRTPLVGAQGYQRFPLAKPGVGIIAGME